MKKYRIIKKYIRPTLGAAVTLKYICQELVNTTLYSTVSTVAYSYSPSEDKWNNICDCDSQIEAETFIENRIKENILLSTPLEIIKEYES